MKKAVSILAVVVMSIGLFSCESDSSAEETQALYGIQNADATNGNANETDVRD